MKYKTKQKELLYFYFLEHQDSCLTAQELKHIFKEQKIGLTTIYRCLQELEEEHIIHRYIGEKNRSSTYQYHKNIKDVDSHYHLQCTKCHALIHLECDSIKTLTNHIEIEHHFRIDPMKTTIYGLCNQCAKQLEY